MTATSNHMSKKTRVLKANVSETYKTAYEDTGQQILKTPENHVYKPGQVTGRISSTKNFTINIKSPELFKETAGTNKRVGVYTSTIIQSPTKMPDNKNVRGIFCIFNLKNSYRNLHLHVQ